MKTIEPTPDIQTTHLRQRAENELASRNPSIKPVIAEVDTIKLTHELQVHQLELEMQNEEMANANNQAIIAIEKYVDLYDLAPCGYLILTLDGDIKSVNSAAITILERDRTHLKNSRFGLCVSRDSLLTFNNFFENLVNTNTKCSCELSLASKTETWVHLDGIISKNKNECLITMADITDQKRLENDILKKSKELETINLYFLSRETKLIEHKEEINKLLTEAGCDSNFLL